MRTIYKYPLAIKDEQEIEMPGPHVICFQTGIDPMGQLCVWALVSSSMKMQKRRFFITGTGYEIPEEARIWIGSVKVGKFVFHIWTS